MQQMRYIVMFLAVFATAFSAFSQKEETLEVKLEAQISKTGYVGEALVYELTLYSTSPNVADIRVLRNPDIPSDVQVINGIVGNSKFKRISEKGKFKYSKVIQRQYLIPKSSGKLNVKGGEYLLFIPYERLINRGFWNSRIVEYEELRCESNSVASKISSLPKSSTGFTGCVGSFSIQSWFPPGKITRGVEAFVVFKVSGYGSLANLKVPALNKLFQKGCRLKEVEQSEEMMQRDGKLFSEVTLVCTFIPEEDDYEIEGLCIEFFNPETKKYYNACSDLLRGSGNSSNKKRNDSKNDAIAI